MICPISCRGQPFQVRQEQHGPEILGQLRERSLEVQHGHDGRVRRLARGGLVEPIVQVLVEEHRLVRLPPVEREERVPQYLEQPGPEVRSRLEAMGEPEGPEVGLLDQVVGVRWALGQPQGEVVQRVEVGERLLTEFGGRLGQDWPLARDASRMPRPGQGARDQSGYGSTSPSPGSSPRRSVIDW